MDCVITKEVCFVTKRVQHEIMRIMYSSFHKCPNPNTANARVCILATRIQEESRRRHDYADLDILCAISPPTNSQSLLYSPVKRIVSP